MATEATREAFVELQGRLLETDGKLKQVVGQEQACQVDIFTAKTTLDELQELPAETNVYQSIGEFVLQPLGDAKAWEEGKIKEAEATIASLQGSKKYLEKQMREVQSNFKELMEQLPASIPGITQAINGSASST
ncbi:hypothetical protein CLOM_g13752 [Closterium sp. NIES-68]|nr:hypothetical protein CLOM_g13752 [Closterium sp. NIES-68]GJP63648.1 hypothetical protein CLOP_g20714 [Closterium sp. NIES-67]GJP69439.1 hypothetical protein CLOP_g432 [Closterium sp. NIES-67]